MNSPLRLVLIILSQYSSEISSVFNAVGFTPAQLNTTSHQHLTSTSPPLFPVPLPASLLASSVLQFRSSRRTHTMIQLPKLFHNSLNKQFTAIGFGHVTYRNDMRFVLLMSGRCTELPGIVEGFSGDVC